MIQNNYPALTGLKTSARVLAVTILSFSLHSAKSQAGSVFMPEGLGPFQEYRIAYLYDFEFRPVQTIEAANNLVSDAANQGFGSGGPLNLLKNLNAEWFAIASTPTTDAKITTGTDDSPAGANGVPIFLPDGETKIADDYDDLWDGTLDAPLNIDRFGNISAGLVWTGTLTNGLRDPLFELGTPTDIISVGNSSASDSGWINIADAAGSAELFYYGISEVLISIPEPSAMVLLSFGSLALTVRRSR